MSKIDCPACDRKISLEEENCPHCGESIKEFVVKTKTTADRIKDFGVMVISGSLLFGIFAIAGKNPATIYTFFAVFMFGLALFALGRFMK